MAYLNIEKDVYDEGLGTKIPISTVSKLENAVYSIQTCSPKTWRQQKIVSDRDLAPFPPSCSCLSIKVLDGVHLHW